MKALVLDESRVRFLVARKEDGLWELPGGGLDWGMEPSEELRREIREEMGLKIVQIEQHPSYFLTDQGGIPGGWWRGNVVYETVLESLDFTPSDECVEVHFVTAEEAKSLDPQLGNIRMLGGLFDPVRHV